MAVQTYYIGDTCTDINECELNQHNCDLNGNIFTLVNILVNRLIWVNTFEQEYVRINFLVSTVAATKTVSGLATDLIATIMTRGSSQMYDS